MTTLFDASIEPADQFSKSPRIGKVSNFLHFPLVRMIVLLLFLLPAFTFSAVMVMFVIESFEEPVASYVDILRMLVMIPLLLICYRWYCRVFEKRKAVEISFPGAGREWGTGFLVATTLVTLFVALISVFGSFEIIEYQPAGTLVKNILVFGMGSLFQEIILLFVLFRLTEELTGTWIALVISLLIFSFAHIFNPNQTMGSAVFLLLSSIILVAPYILTRRLWLSWGFHAGWNFMQAGVFGMANSGILFPGWMVTRVGGPEWLTGGAIGLEASYLALGADMIIGYLMLYVAIRMGKTLKPRWKRVALLNNV